MRRPIVSVVISTFNYARYIGQTIESVLQQDFPSSDIEIIVLDDASTDATPDRVRPYLDRVRYIRQDVNIGLVPTLNRGFEMAAGKYICPLDADDMWMPQKLKTVVDFFEKNPVFGALTHGAKIVDHDGRDTGFSRSLPSRDRYTFEDLLAKPPQLGHLGCVAFLRDILQKILPIPGNRRFVLPDIYMFYHSLFYAPAAVIPDRLTLYRAHESNLSDRLGASKANLKDLRMASYCVRILDGNLKKRLRSFGRMLHWSKEELEQRRADRLERLILESAYCGRRRMACRLSQELLKGFPLRKKIFKAAAFGLAISFPTGYRWVFLAYRGIRQRSAIARLGSGEPSDS